MLGSKNPRVVGLALILVVALIWVLASFVVQELDNTIHPFLITYVCNSLFVLYLPISLLVERLQRPQTHTAVPPDDVRPGLHNTDQGADLDADDRPADAHESAEVASLEIEAGTPADAASLLAHGAKAAPTGALAILRAAACVSPFWFLAQLTFNLSLSMTSVTSNTILSSPSSVFTFLLSVLVLHERFTSLKAVAIFLTVAGTVCVALGDKIMGSDEEGPRSGLLGDLLSIVSCGFYATYTVLLKLLMPMDSESLAMRFFGFLGLVNFVLFLPVCVALQLSGLLQLQMITGAALGALVMKGLLDNVLSDYLWSHSVVLIGPTIATMGLSLQVPLAMLLDPLLHTTGWWSQLSSAMFETVGAGAILGGFFMICRESP